MHKNYPIGLLLTVILMVSSCTTTKMYDGPQLPSDKVAILKPEAIIVTVDGRSPEFNFFSDMQLAVFPGKRTLEIQVSSWAGRAIGILSFEAEAGRTYIVQGRLVLYHGAMVWIEDAETHEIIAGQKPQ